MAKLRSLIMLAAFAVVAVLVGGWFVLVSPKNAAAADLNAKAAQEAPKQQALQQQINMLKVDEKQASAYQRRLDAVALHLPVGAALPGLMRELTKAADATNVRIEEITPSIPTAANAALITVPAAKPTGNASPGTTASPPSGPTEATAASSAPAAPAAAAPGLVLSQVPITFVVSGTYSGISDFVARIQNFKRALLVQTINLAIAPPVARGGTTAKSPNGYSGLLTATIGGSAFTSGSPAEAGIEVTATPTARPAVPMPAQPMPSTSDIAKGSSS